MFEIIFYRDKNGDSQIQDTLEDLRIKSKTDKEALVDFAKITLYITLLSEYGLSLNSNFIKHLDHEIWELRPRKNRILFFGYNHNKFVLLHSFI